MERIRVIYILWTIIFVSGSVNASVNLALKKTANQSSMYAPSFGASKVVDGCTNQLLFSYCCSHTAGGFKTVWWQVDLGNVYNVESTKLIYRNEGTIQTFKGYSVFFSNKSDIPGEYLCYHHEYPTAIDYIEEIKCEHMARYVTVYNSRNDTNYAGYSPEAVLELCEVEVYGCESGRYGDGNCDSSCTNCYNNVCHPTTGDCQLCSPGKYGPKCEHTCSDGCTTRTCTKKDGHCSPCIIGRYGDRCNQSCPVNCKDRRCDEVTGDCSACVHGKYGLKCDKDCPFGCKDDVCEFTTGICSECVSGKTGPLCDQNCSAGCLLNFCDQLTGNCFPCKNGIYGNTCDSKCPRLCKDGLCHSVTGECFSCQPGYYSIRCNKICPADCKDSACNFTTGLCEACNAGYYGDYCNNICPDGCKDKTCHFNTGHCTVCNVGHYGSDCTLRCSEGCANSCELYTGYCSPCVNGRYGSQCSQICPSGCRDSQCHVISGHCSECIVGKYGDRCDNNCPTACASNICDSKTGKCSECPSGQYGSFCELKCMENCSQCDITDGHCTVCINGKYGENCTEECVNCKDGLCAIQDGKCTKGCIAGRSGPECQPLNVAGLTDDTAIIGIGMAAAIVGGIILIVVSVCLVACGVRRKRRQEQEKKMAAAHSVSYIPRAHVTSDMNHRQSLIRHWSIPRPVHDDIFLSLPLDLKESDSSTDSVSVYSGKVSNSVLLNDLRAFVMIKLENNAKILRDEFKSLTPGSVFPHEESSKPQNKLKNRYKDQYAYDHSRITLITEGDKSDYINANYIDGVDTLKAYVATQGPKWNTIDDFWRMIWQLKSGKVVMLSNLIENNKVKCDKYWPDEGATLSTTSFNLRMDIEKEYTYYRWRNITVMEKETGQTRHVEQYNFTMWPDNGIPILQEIVKFHQQVLMYDALGPMIVHCSAGYGRTGTFIALDALLSYGRKTGKVNIKGYVEKMRRNRMNMITSAEQYIALHEMLVEAFEQQDLILPHRDQVAKYNELNNERNEADHYRHNEDNQLYNTQRSGYRASPTQQKRQIEDHIVST